ncbi:F0F1 ATP synthase subunit B [Candidatus Uhrbacteria bacterium]|nr:F0F1 ATP synthase subunit B [Candidatus Uhrbacteria bacterium]
MSAELETMQVVAEHAAQSTSFIDTLGLNWKLFIAQLVNFSVIVLILWRWVYRPLVSLLDARTEKIERSLADAKRIEQELQQLELTKNATLREARHESQRLIDEAAKKSAALREELLAQSRADAAKVLHDATATIAHEKEKMLTEVRTHVADLVVTATEKILQEKIDGKKDKEMVEATVKHLTSDN